MPSKRKTASISGPLAIPWKPPTPDEQKKMAAKDLADTLIRIHPKIQRLKEELAKDIESTVDELVDGSIRRVTSGGKPVVKRRK